MLMPSDWPTVEERREVDEMFATLQSGRCVNPSMVAQERSMLRESTSVKAFRVEWDKACKVYYHVAYRVPA